MMEEWQDAFEKWRKARDIPYDAFSLASVFEAGWWAAREPQDYNPPQEDEKHDARTA